MQISRATIFISHLDSHRMKFVEENKNKTEIKNSFSYAFACTNNCINYLLVTELYSLIMEKYSEKIWMIIYFWHNLISEVTFSFDKRVEETLNRLGDVGIEIYSLLTSYSTNSILSSS